MRHQWLLVIALLAVTSGSSGHIGRGEVSQSDNVNYCRKHLARTLAALCLGLRQEHKMIAGMRTEDGGMYNTLISHYYKEQEPRRNEYVWPWLGPYKTNRMGLPSTGKRSVVNECCENPCSFNELMTYCWTS